MKNESACADIAQNIVRRILEEFTYHHDKLKIWAEPMGRVQIVYVQTHKADMPRVIGKQGAHRTALFNLVSLIGLRYSSELRLENVEPEVGNVEKFAPFKPAAKWNPKPFIQLVKDICAATLLYQVEVTCHDAGHTPTSTIQVVVSDQEHMATVATLTESLKVLMNAVGKANGRILLVDAISQRELARTSVKA